MPDEAFDVAIVGFGPTGAALANLLGASGVRTVVVEREPEVYALPRAVHFDDEIMRVFQSLGLADAILPHTGPAEAYVFVNGEGREILHFDIRGEQTSQGWKPHYTFHQPSLEQALRDGAERHASVSVRLGWEVSAIREEAAGVALRLRDAAGREETLCAAYVVGCDGASSPTRRAAGLALDDLGFDEPWLVVDAMIDRPPAELGLPAVMVQRCDPARPVTFVPLSGPYIRWEFMLRPGEGDEMKSDARVRALVSEWVAPDSVRIIRSALYRFHALVGRSWRRGRLLIAGDAAHQMPPFLGQGMCSGIRDAMNLAWKLEWVLRGRASEALLATYETERIPHVREIIGLAIEMGRIICTQDTEQARARDERLLAAGAERVPAPAMPRFADGLLQPAPRSPAVGGLALQATVRDTTGEPRLLDETTGAGLRLLSSEPLPAFVGATDAHFRRLGGHHTVLDPKGTAPPVDARTDGVTRVEDVEGRYAEWFASIEASHVLVRPDHVVFGTGRDASDAAALVDALASQLQPPG